MAMSYLRAYYLKRTSKNVILRACLPTGVAYFHFQIFLDGPLAAWVVFKLLCSDKVTILATAWPEF